MKIPAIYVWSLLLVAVAVAASALTSRPTLTATEQLKMPFAVTESEANEFSLTTYQCLSPTEDDIRYGVVHCTAIQRLKEIADDLEKHKLTSDAEAIRTACQKLRTGAKSIPWTIEPETQFFSFSIANYGR